MGKENVPLAPSLVHVFTAFGVVCALLATLAVAARDYPAMFAWLGLALVIDGLDGPLARAVDVKGRLPRFSGDRLDLIIDYMTYVFIPVLAMLDAGLFPAAFAIPLAALILLSSLFHFSDTQSKAADNSFVGFPAIWNVIAFYLFVFQLPPWLASVLALVCIALTFVPTRWVHPMRVEAWRGVTLAATALWLIAAAAALWFGFAGVPVWAKFALAAVAVYLLALPVLTRPAN